MDFRWGLVLSGHEFDLDEWCDAFPSHHWPKAERRRGELLFFTQELDAASDSLQAYEMGRDLLARTNGLMKIQRDTQPLELRGIAERGADDKVKIQIFASIEIHAARARAHAVGEAVGANGEIIALVQTETVEQEKFVSAANNELLSDALIYMSHSDSWFDLYKAFECIRAYAGGDHKLVTRGWTTKPEKYRFTKTANAIYRHRKGGDSPPPQPMTTQEAEEFVARLIQHGLSEAALQS